MHSFNMMQTLETGFPHSLWTYLQRRSTIRAVTRILVLGHVGVVGNGVAFRGPTGGRDRHPPCTYSEGGYPIKKLALKNSCRGHPNQVVGSRHPSKL